MFLHTNHILKTQSVLTRKWNSGQIAINCSQKCKEIKGPLKIKCPWRACLLLQKWPYSTTKSTLHFLLTNYCSGSTREVTTKSLALLFSTLRAHKPSCLPTSYWQLQLTNSHEQTSEICFDLRQLRGYWLFSDLTNLIQKQNTKNTSTFSKSHIKYTPGLKISRVQSELLILYPRYSYSLWSNSHHFLIISFILHLGPLLSLPS